MKLLISPAKKMRAEDFLPPRTQPPLLEKSAQLLDYVRGLSLPQLKRLLACNESLAQEAFENFRAMELGRGTTPALLAYDGIQYKYMAPGVFTQAQLEYVGEHLRILSGFYGVLRPFDGVSPYRLEMQAKVKAPFCKNLYDFWGDSLGEFLLQEDSVLVNLASEVPALPAGAAAGQSCRTGRLDAGRPNQTDGTGRVRVCALQSGLEAGGGAGAGPLPGHRPARRHGAGTDDA